MGLNIIRIQRPDAPVCLLARTNVEEDGMHIFKCLFLYSVLVVS